MDHHNFCCIQPIALIFRGRPRNIAAGPPGTNQSNGSRGQEVTMHQFLQRCLLLVY